jgi:NAD(P)H-flavin reductase
MTGYAIVVTVKTWDPDGGTCSGLLLDDGGLGTPTVYPTAEEAAAALEHVRAIFGPQLVDHQVFPCQFQAINGGSL